MNDEELQQVLGELRDEPLPFASVRERVLAVAARERRRRVIPIWTWSMAAAAALLVMTFAVRPAWRAEVLILPAPPTLVVRTPVFQVANKAVPIMRVKHAEPANEAFTVKMLTDDPDVVVYWIVGGEGDSI